MKLTLRELDILICEKVYGEKVDVLNQTHGWRIDCVSSNRNSKANDPIYALDMVDGYRLKKFSTNTDNIMELISKANEKGANIEMYQSGSDEKEWTVRYVNGGEFFSKNNESLPVALCLTVLALYEDPEKVCSYIVE